VTGSITNATIANNFVTNTTAQAIVIGAGDRVVISGNVVTKGGTGGIDCRATHAIVEGNVMG